jgi:drug/metabolite transporter (DMT)-like permease
MMWLVLSLIAAISSATADAMTKKHFSGLTAYEMGSVRLAYTLPWLGIAMLLIPWPSLDRLFFLAIACGLPLELLAFWCYMKAIKVSPLSLTLPFLAFTPICMILTGWIVLGETVTLPGIIGIILIVIGSYCLNLSQAATGIWGPIKAVAKEPGSRLMLLVAFIYSITSTIGKLGVIHSSPSFFGITYFMSLSMLMFGGLPLVPGAKMSRILTKPSVGLLIGAIYAIMIFSHMLAISMVQAAYMISIKRMSLLFGVLYGAFLFKEEKIAERMTGAFIMVCGVLIIGFFG